MAHTKKHQYTKAKAIDRQCRNHGSCSYCEGNRIYKNNKRFEATEQELKQI